MKFRVFRWNLTVLLITMIDSLSRFVKFGRQSFQELHENGKLLRRSEVM